MIDTKIDIIVKQKVFNYPVLVQSQSDSKIVLAYENTKNDNESFTGIVVATSDNTGIGSWCNCWKKSAFEVFSGEISMKQ